MWSSLGAGAGAGAGARTSFLVDSVVSDMKAYLFWLTGGGHRNRLGEHSVVCDAAHACGIAVLPGNRAPGDLSCVRGVQSGKPGERATRGAATKTSSLEHGHGPTSGRVEKN